MMFIVYELDVVTPDSLGRFVHRWYGPPDRPAVELPAVDLPPSLAGWHRLAARYSLPLSRDHEMRPPEELHEVDGMVTFWEGERDSYAYRQDAVHAVFESDGRALSESDGWAVFESDGAGWLPTGLTLPAFLVYATVYEATYAALHSLVLTQPGPDELDEVRLRLRPLDDPIWQWPDPEVRYYGDDDLLGHLGPDRIVLAARHRDALGRFDGLDLPWEWDTRPFTPA